MSSVPSEPDPLEATLQSTRQSVRQLEMDTYRVRTDLTRLEVALEAIKHPDVEATSGDRSTFENEHTAVDERDVTDWQSKPVGVEVPALELGTLEAQSVETCIDEHTDQEDSASSMAVPDLSMDAPVEDKPLLAPAIGRRRGPIHRFFTTPVVASLVLHGVVLFAIVSITVAAVVRSEPAFTTTILDLGEKAPEHNENFDLGQLAPLDSDNFGAPSEAAHPLQAGSAEPISNDVVPVDFESEAVGPSNAGEAGLIGPLQSDDGTMPAGEGGNSSNGSGKPTGSGSSQKRGSTGSGRTGGPAGSAMFFGMQTKGDRFVFVVDNSSSMKNGRFEMAVAELVKTVEGLSPRQSFYVIFVSDQPYPMFYPQAEPELISATPQNKNRLREWLPKAILASGHNRELIHAMDMAAALWPQAVYLLWDGDLKYSDAVRRDVMAHLTAPNQWNFVVHTIGLGITSLDGEQNLTTIAQAHHGAYRRVEVPNLRGH